MLHVAFPQFTAVYAESQDEKRECHDFLETPTDHWESLTTQELIEQGMSASCLYRRNWYMIGVRAPASPHDLA